MVFALFYFYVGSLISYGILLRTGFYYVRDSTTYETALRTKSHGFRPLLLYVGSSIPYGA
jgi:hypothetical protein